MKTKNFTWDANINFAKNYNEVVKLHEDVKDFELAAARCQTDTAHCIVFEDILKAVQGAKDGGFYTVAVYDAASAQEQEEIKKLCDRYINDYEELE